MAAGSLGAGRSVIAGVLLAAALAAILGAWFVTGWREVAARQQQSRAAPAAAAEQRSAELARELRTELEGLIGREVRRRYFEYQNLFHDPRASAGQSVTPSPLAAGPDDPLVLGYFQIDASARVTTPPINDDFPNLSEPKRLAENRAFRDAVSRELAHRLAPDVASRPLIAQAEPRPPVKPPQPPSHAPVHAPPSTPPGNTTHVYQIDPSTYAQNVNSNAVYWQQEASHPVVASVEPPIVQAPVVRPPIARPANPVVRPAPPAPVTITVSPLEWRTLPFAGAPALVAVRQVQTPDGNLAQGFVVDRATVTGMLASRAGDMVAELSATDHGGAEVVPGWQLSVAPNPHALAATASNIASIAQAFLIRFLAIGSLALLAASLVVMLVVRAERLARERSQFAAAAAHELRTPLAGLQLYGDMLADGLGDPGKLRDYARRMSEEASRLGRVVSNVLGFSQLERGNLSVDATPGALDEVLRDLADRAQPALDRAGAALELEVPDGLRARFDRDGLTRIIGNLLDNAEKYARDAADRTIRIAAAAADDVVEIVITDRGPGIREHTRLFRPFRRGVSSEGPAGLGLGLALSRSLARAMGGDLSYRDARGGGASFVVRLPRA